VIFITKNLQQRELFLIFTRFPFNPQERNQMQDEGNKKIEYFMFYSKVNERQDQSTKEFYD
jgi:hypothetical protein